MEAPILILTFMANALICNALAFVFTKYTEFKTKPFNCYGCLSFWLSFVFGWAISYYLAPSHGVAFLGFVAFAIGLLNYFYVKSKFQIYE